MGRQEESAVSGRLDCFKGDNIALACVSKDCRVTDCLFARSVPIVEADSVRYTDFFGGLTTAHVSEEPEIKLRSTISNGR